MAQLGYYFFNWDVIARNLPALLQGFLLTLLLSLVIVVLGLSLGLLLAFVRSYQVRLLNIFILAFVDIFRAVPQLVLVVLIYFALPYVGSTLSPFWATVTALSLVLAAFAEEIFWAGITSLQRGQWEAARSTGLNFSQAFIWVVLPQALKLATPPLTNRVLAIVKGTSLGSVIAVPELLSVATSAQSQAANPSPLTMGAILYLILFLPFTLLIRKLERRYGRR